MVRSDRARQVLLGITAGVFAVLAVRALVDPHGVAAHVGYRLDNPDAFSEFRAVYVGLWLATAVLLVVALRRIDEPILGDLGALLVAGQVFGRVVSLLLDGPPTPRLWPIAGLEAVGAVALFLVRPRRR